MTISQVSIHNQRQFLVLIKQLQILNFAVTTKLYISVFIMDYAALHLYPIYNKVNLQSMLRKTKLCDCAYEAHLLILIVYTRGRQP